MEFKTGELEARLNRKEQMIAKLENDLREVSYFTISVAVSFLLLNFFVSNGAMQNTGKYMYSTISCNHGGFKDLLFCPQSGIECSIKLCTNEDRDTTSSGN